MIDPKELEGKVCHYAVWRAADSWSHCANPVRSIIRGKPCCARHTPERLQKRAKKRREHEKREREWVEREKQSTHMSRQLMLMIYLRDVVVTETGDVPKGWAMSTAAAVLRKADPNVDLVAYEIDRARVIKWIEQVEQAHGPAQKVRPS